MCSLRPHREAPKPTGVMWVQSQAVGKLTGVPVPPAWGLWALIREGIGSFFI